MEREVTVESSGSRIGGREVTMEYGGVVMARLRAGGPVSNDGSHNPGNDGCGEGTEWSGHACEAGLKFWALDWERVDEVMSDSEELWRQPGRIINVMSNVVIASRRERSGEVMR